MSNGDSNAPQSPKELPVVSLKAINIGSMNQYNPAVDVGFNYSFKDTQFSRSTALNNLQQAPDRQIQTYSAMVAAVDPIPQPPRNVSWWREWFSDEKPPDQVSLYVFIDARHFDIINILEPWNYRTLLTRVETGKKLGLGPGSVIEVAVSDGDFSRATLVDVKDDQVRPLGEMITNKAAKTFFNNCDEVAGQPKQPSPSSIPTYRSNNNVGYIQLVYALAQWQTALGKKVVIKEIRYPVTETSTIGQRIKNLMQGSKDFNKQQKPGMVANQQFLRTTNDLLGSKIEYGGVAGPAVRVIITVDKTSNFPRYINRFMTFHKGYSSTLVKKDGKTYTYNFSFGDTDGGAAPSTAAAIATTEQNFAKFMAKLNKEIMPQPTRPNTPPTQPSLQPGECDAAGRLTQFDGDIASVTEVAVPSLRPNKSCSQLRKTIVLHTPAMGNVSAKSIRNVLDHRCLDGKKLRQQKKKDKDPVYADVEDYEDGSQKGYPKCPRIRQGLSVHFIVSPNETMQTLPLSKCAIHAGTPFNAHSVAVEFGAKTNGNYWNTLISNFPTQAHFEKLYAVCEEVAKKLSGNNDTATAKEFMKNKFLIGNQFFLGWSGYSSSPVKGGLPKGVVSHWRQVTPDDKIGGKHWDALIAELYVQLRANGRESKASYDLLLPVAKAVRAESKKGYTKFKMKYINVTTARII